MINSTAMERLVNEILLQCVKDYVEMYKYIIKHGFCTREELYYMLDHGSLTSRQYDEDFIPDHDNCVTFSQCYTRLQEIEYFFLSDWFVFLVGDKFDGSVLLESIRRMAINGKFDEEYKAMIAYKRKVEHPKKRAKSKLLAP